MEFGFKNDIFWTNRHFTDLNMNKVNNQDFKVCLTEHFQMNK